MYYSYLYLKYFKLCLLYAFIDYMFSESNTSPKSKNWRGHLKRPFMKKVQSGSPAATPTLPEGATIGVCLEDCPQVHLFMTLFLIQYSNLTFVILCSFFNIPA